MDDRGLNMHDGLCLLPRFSDLGKCGLTQDLHSLDSSYVSIKHLCVLIHFSYILNTKTFTVKHINWPA